LLSDHPDIGSRLTFQEKGVLEAVAVAWLMLSVALFVAMSREDAMQLSRDTINRLWRAIGVL
jgi:hypothetical protein